MSDLVREKAPAFPISKVKKIAKCDPEYVITSNAAVSATAFAAELFVQNLVEESLVLAQLNSRGKSSLRLSLASIEECVEKRENFRFLEDVIKQLKKNSIHDKKGQLGRQPDLDDQQVAKEELQPDQDDDEGAEIEEDEEDEEEQEPEEDDSVQEEELMDDHEGNKDDKPTRSVAGLLSRFQYQSAPDTGEHSGSSDVETYDGKSIDD
ncbi:DNA polymerase epsilon noncatalytic subunit [Saccharomyces eubayanus]|uniref:DNA polymerase epsilon noncatalytic subunit n=1 Tax=Saccharomyces eubayanus TaxID=1080349 RepID=UPI0006BFD27C|nr:DPB3-like protein [Saccharomyces eubayanus]KOH00588.1 DPB3-like protein [Saccharomyces eubayanus]